MWIHLTSSLGRHNMGVLTGPTRDNLSAENQSNILSVPRPACCLRSRKHGSLTAQGVGFLFKGNCDG